MGSVTLSMDEFKDLEQAKHNAEASITRLTAEVVAAKLEDKDDRVRKLVELVRALMTPLRFAIANMPSEVTAHWPTASLRAIALLLPNMPEASSDDQSLIAELLLFADGADQHTRQRAKKKQTDAIDEKASAR